MHDQCGVKTWNICGQNVFVVLRLREARNLCCGA